MSKPKAKSKPVHGLSAIRSIWAWRNPTYCGNTNGKSFIAFSIKDITCNKCKMALKEGAR